MRRVARFVARKLRVYGLYSLRIKGPLHDDGWFRSFEEGSSVDAEGNPLPFIAYAALEFLTRRIHPSMSVFEYGSGFSTLWWASRVKEVIACEHDEGWYHRVSSHAPANVMMHHVPLKYDGDYCRFAAQFPGRFDIVVIDGRDRVNCASHALVALKPSGVILWDNTNRLEYQAAFDSLFGRGFRKLEFVSMAPIMNEKVETSIFYRSDNCLGI